MADSKKIASKRKSAKKARKKKIVPTRIYPRADFPGRVYVHDKDKLYIAPLINISASGIFVRDITNIPTGTEVKLVIKSPSLGRTVQALGDVVRVERSKKRHGLAVHFTDIAHDTRNVIAKSVEMSHLNDPVELLRAFA